MKKNPNGLITKTYMLDFTDVDTIDNYAKERGYPSASSALRRIINEWKVLKSAPLPELASADQPCNTAA